MATTDPYRGSRGSVRSMLSSTRARLAVAVAAVAFYAIFIFRTSFSIGGTRYFVLFETR